MSINAALKQNSETGKNNIRFWQGPIWQIYDLALLQFGKFTIYRILDYLSLRVGNTTRFALAFCICFWWSERLPNRKSYVSYTILWNNMQKRTSFSNRQLVKLPNSIPFLHNFSTYFRLNRTKENSKSTCIFYFSKEI